MPKDPLGFSELIIDDLKKSGVEASDIGATMDEKGTVEVRRSITKKTLPVIDWV